MKKEKGIGSSVFAIFAMLILMIDSKTAVSGAKEGLALCFQTVIPSLFPFFIFSGILNSSILGVKSRILAIIGRICKIPKGAEPLFLLGVIAGYPVGAQGISQAYGSKQISSSDAERLLGFCNNAGPSFIFGILSPLLSRPILVWLLWIINIVSALLVGAAIPGGSSQKSKVDKRSAVSYAEALQNAIKNLATVCGWIIFFRVLLAFCEKWFLWRLSPYLRIIFSGILELSNGCLQLSTLPMESARFVLAAVMLSGGGICVAMQTKSVIGNLDIHNYFPGKALQSTISLLISLLMQYILFPKSQRMILPIFTIPALFGIILFFLYLFRKKCSF